jgi:hypothetical protein
MSIRYGSFLRSTVTAFAISSVATLLLCSPAWKRRLETMRRRPHAKRSVFAGEFVLSLGLAAFGRFG